MKAVFGKWLVRELGLIASNPFAAVKPPKCDEPEIRLVTAGELTTLATWFVEQWGEWSLPLVYLDVLGMLGWRATEVASIKSEDLLDDGFLRVTSDVVKTRRTKIGWLPPDLMADVRACAADGYAFGRFSDELRRRLMLVRKRPHHAARTKAFTPKRLVGWWQDQLRKFGGGFTLHDFRRTAVSGLHMAGVSEKESSVLLGVSPEVMRRHYEQLDQRVIAKRSIQKRLGEQPAQSGRTLWRIGQNVSLDGSPKSSQTVSA